MRGVYEKVKDSGDWYISYFDADGRHHRQHVGRYAKAVEAYVNKKREIREGKFVQPGPSEKPLTLEEVFELRMMAMHLSQNTQRCYRYQFGTGHFDAFRKLPIRKIRAQDVDRVLGGLRKEEKGPQTISNYRALLGAIFTYALEHDHVSANPVRKTQSPKLPRGRVRFLSLDEEASIRRVLEKFWPERVAEFDLLLHSGMRIGELWHLTWDRVHLERGILEVPDEGKTGWRDVPINSVARQAVEILHRQSRGSKFVVPNVYAKRGRRYLALWIGEAADNAGVLEITPHTLRHTFASRLVMAGVPLPRVQQYLGHASIEMTIKYAHLAPEQGTPDIERMVTPAAARVKPPARVAKPRVVKIA